MRPLRLVLGSILLVCAFGWAGPARAQAIAWQMANEYPATSIHGEGDQFFGRELRERSGGANGVGITTEVPPAFLEALAKAGQVAIDEWVARAGPSGQEILDTYRKRRGDGGR